MYAPPVVSDTEWAQAIAELRVEEKRATRERDALAARRRPDEYESVVAR